MAHEPVKGLAEFGIADGMELALSYLEDPGDIACPICGPGSVEVMAYLESGHMRSGILAPAAPEGDYTVVLYCHGCARAAALDFSPAGPPDDRER